MNRTSEIGEDANITIFLKERKRVVGRTAHTKLFFFFISMSSQVLLSSFPLCTRQAFTTGNPPCLCPRVIWTPRSHLRRKGYQFRGIEKRIPMELPITSILKQNPCKPSHHRNHRPWWENCQVLLRLQLRPQKKKKKNVPASPSVWFGSWKNRAFDQASSQNFQSFPHFPWQKPGWWSTPGRKVIYQFGRGK